MLTGNELTASKAFVAISLFNILRFPLVMLPNVIISLIQVINNKYYYSLSRKTVNARENFWNVYCFATNQMRDETAKGDRQTAEWINHDLTRNNEFALSLILLFSNTEVFLFLLQLCCHQRIDMSDILRIAKLISRRQDQTQLDSASESKKK